MTLPIETTPLHRVADIQTGYVFRSRITEAPNGALRVIRNTDLRMGHVSLQDNVRVDIPDRGNQWRLRRGDILLRTRGQDTAVALIPKTPDEETIAAAPLTVIRVRQPETTDSAYLAWQIAQSDVQRYLNLAAQGSAIPTVNKRVIEQIPLHLPPIEEQRRIAEIATLSADLRRLTHRLADLEAAYIDSLLHA